MRRNIIESAMHYRSIMLLITVTFVAFGVYAIIVMPKNEFPEFTVRQGVVVAAYPGASTDEMETQVTKPLENFMWTFKEVVKEKTYSQTREGLCYVYVTLDKINSKDEFWSMFKHRLEAFKGQLPSGVLLLQAIDDFADCSAMLITIESEDKTYRELHEYVDDLSRRLRTLPELSAIRVYGEQKEQISVYIDRDRLSSYGVGAASIITALQQQGIQIISGSVDDHNLVRPIHIASETATENDIAETIITTDPTGHSVIRLKDVAVIKREYPDPESYVENNGKKCVVVSVEMQAGHNIVDFGKKVKKEIDAFKETLPESVDIFTITDQSQVVGDSVKEFLKELLISIIAVIIVIMLLLPFRVASVAASTIPITIFITMAVFYATGVELNTVTLAVLIVSLGMIVDNSVVIVDCYLEKIGQGMSRWHAASASAVEFLPAIISATLAISITFYPMIFTVTDMIKEFIKWFPVAITIVLAISLLIAVFVVPSMQYTVIRQPLRTDGGLLIKMQNWYGNLIDRCFSYPKVTLAIGFACVIGGALLFMIVPQRLMPRAERNQFAVEIFLPTGTAIQRTAAVADSLREKIRKDKRIVNITTFYGSGSPRFHMSYAPQPGGSNFAQFIVNTTGNKATEELIEKYSEEYADYFPGVYVRIKQLDFSDAQAPVEIRFEGGDLDGLYLLTEKAAAIMRRNHDLLIVRTNFQGTQPGLNVRLNKEESNRLGLSKTVVALNLATHFSQGLPMATVWDGDYPISVVLKDNRADRQTAADLENAQINGMLPGMSVPLRQTATVTPDFHYGQIQHYNGVRSMSVMADNVFGSNLTEVTKKVAESVDSLKTIAAEKGVTMKIGGQYEKDNDYGPQIYNGLALSIIVILLILLYHFRNIKLCLLIMLSLLFAIPGVPIAMIIMGQDLSVTGTLGMISLMGIIVRNGIIMVDYAEVLRIKHHLSAKHAALNAAKRRLRPIFLTSAAASMGCVPMVISNSPMWGPMGVTVCYGTIISMLFIITMIPVAYWMIMRTKDKNRHYVRQEI